MKFSLLFLQTTKAFLSKMREMDHGYIATVAGTSGQFAAPHLENYHASKFAAVGFREAPSPELKAKHVNGLKTTLVWPSLTESMIPFPIVFLRQEINMVFSPLKSSCCVKAAMKAILSSQTTIHMPTMVYFALLPWDVQVLAHKFLGISKCMYLISR
uniref:Uncharacterized protein n=1 Tax=Apteryx owenii TaxID=8824 RepID=A0A8B9S2N9_APTOW